MVYEVLAWAFLIGLCLYLLYRTVYIQKGLSLVIELLRAYLAGDLKKRLYLEKEDRLNEIASLLNQLAELCEEKTHEATWKGYSLKAVLESLPDAIAVLGPDERVHLVNPAFLKLVNMTEGDVLERPITEVLNIPEVSRIVEGARAEGQVKTEVFSDEETQRHFRAIGCPLGASPKEGLSVVLLLHDITEARRTEQVRRDFVGNVSHELKTPIATIKAYAETLLEGAMDETETLREFLETILSYSQRMEGLVNDLLQLTKIETGVIKIDKRPLALKDTLEGLCREFSERASQKGISLICEVWPEDLTIEADPVRFSQIMYNLVDNAVKFTDEGHVMLRARQRENSVTIEVSDTGPGIPRWALPRLGERFFRVDPSRSRALGGTGLGLAIVKHLVQAHNWKITFDSTPGKGTEVRIIIPPSAI